ncbi:MAG: hypothetical protein AAB885_02430, partial [Patescibacteria group bacterium]
MSTSALKRVQKNQNLLYYAVNHYLNSEKEDLKLSEKIVSGYKKLRGLFKELTAPQTIQAPRLNLEDYKKTPYFSTLVKLSKLAKTELAPYIKTFFVHGSLATMDFVPKFSDLDTLVILKKETCSNPEKLQEFREKLVRARKLLQEVDPLAHHGFIFCAEQNLDYYPQHYLPVAVLKYAKILHGVAKLTFRVRDSREEAKENFYHYYNIFQDITKTGQITNKHGSELYKFKWFVSMLLLMPSLYLQAKGIYLYKKYSFDFVKHPFLSKLSLVRKDFQNAKKILGDNYLKKAVEMLVDWASDLQQLEKDPKFINNPKKIAVKVYERARKELINHFQKNNDVVALYEYGSVRAPGISDLDLILVTKNHLKNR